MKKTWIKIKRGLLRPEHRERLGIRIWLYMYMLDRVDWEAGTIFGWKDKDEAEDFGMAWRTLQKQRQEIEEMDYITCIKRKHSQDIVIHKWVNPREYDGTEYNKSTQKGVHSESKSTRKSTRKPLSKVGTPTSNSQVKSHKENNIPKPPEDINKNGIPDELKTEEFFIIWDEFKLHRKQIKKPMTPLAEARMLKKLSRSNVNVAVLMVEKSIENGWQGVFELDKKEKEVAMSKPAVFVEWS